MTKLWIRAEASPSIGLGHVMRTMALAEAAGEQGHDVEYVVPDQRWVVELVQGRGFAVATTAAPSDDAWLRRVESDDVVVFDGYGFTAADHRSARARAAAVGIIDDTGGGHYDVDVVINPNPVAAGGYTLGARTRLLVGPRYALVRREFRIPRPSQPHPPGLLLTFGGSDPAGLGRLVVELLERWRPFEHVRLVVGPAAAGDVPSRPWLQIVRNPPAPADVFAGAAAAISAAGSTTWELLTLGVPVALVEVATNQRVVVQGAVTAGAALDAGHPGTLPDILPRVLQQLAQPAVRRALTAAGHALVDGHGAARVLTSLVG